MDNSLWMEFKNDKRYPKLENKIKSDICIIGGGLTGLTLAYYLSKEKRDVKLIEKDIICNHTSGNTTAKITSEHGLFYSYLLQSVGRKETKQYLEANEKAIKNIKEIVNEENIECDFEEKDAYVFTQKQEEVIKIKKEVEALKYLDFDCEFLENIELPIKDKNKESSENNISIQKEVLGAIRFKNQAQFNPILYGQGLANKIIERGGEIYENSKVVDIKKDGEYYKVITEKGEINSKIVVLATHYPIISAPGFYFMKMYQETSYLIAAETNKQLFNGMYITSEEPTISLRTAKIGDKEVFLVGGMKHKTGAKIDLKNSYRVIVLQRGK